MSAFYIFLSLGAAAAILGLLIMSVCVRALQRGLADGVGMGRVARFAYTDAFNHLVYQTSGVPSQDELEKIKSIQAKLVRSYRQHAKTLVPADDAEKLALAKYSQVTEENKAVTLRIVRARKIHDYSGGAAGRYLVRKVQRKIHAGTAGGLNG